MRVGNWRNKSKLKFDNPLPKLVFFKEKPQFNDSIFYLFSIYLVFQRNKPVRINPGTPCTPVEPVSPITPDRPAITQSPFYITIKRAQITAAKEPSGLLRSDSKHPDGATLWPWAKVKLMASDVTVPDTFTSPVLAPMQPSRERQPNRQQTTRLQYQGLEKTHIFFPSCHWDSEIMEPASHWTGARNRETYHCHHRGQQRNHLPVSQLLYSFTPFYNF